MEEREQIRHTVDGGSRLTIKNSQGFRYFGNPREFYALRLLKNSNVQKIRTVQ